MFSNGSISFMTYSLGLAFLSQGLGHVISIYDEPVVRGRMQFDNNALKSREYILKLIGSSKNWATEHLIGLGVS